MPRCNQVPMFQKLSDKICFILADSILQERLLSHRKALKLARKIEEKSCKMMIPQRGVLSWGVRRSLPWPSRFHLPGSSAVIALSWRTAASKTETALDLSQPPSQRETVSTLHFLWQSWDPPWTVEESHFHFYNLCLAYPRCTRISMKSLHPCLTASW